MRVIIKSNIYELSNLEGKILIATECLHSSVQIRTSELLRVGVPREELNEEDLTERWLFLPDEYEIVKPEFENCSDSNVGKGWEGFYEQKPIKKSKFRNH